MSQLARVTMILVAVFLLCCEATLSIVGKETIGCRGLHIISLRDGTSMRYGYISCSGTEVLPPTYEQIFDFSDGVGVAVDGRGSVIVDVRGRKKVLPGIYLRTKFSEGIAIATTTNKRYVLAKTGLVVSELPKESLDDGPPFFFAEHFSFGLAPINTSRGIGFINSSGKFVIPPRFDNVSDFRYGRAAVEIDGKWSLIDLQGKTIIPPINDFKISMPPPSDGLVVIRGLEDEWAYFNLDGKLFLRVKYDYAGSFFGGLAQVNRGPTWGFIDKRGKEVIGLKFQAVEDFSDNVAAVKVGSKWGFIDQKGKWVISPAFDDVLKPFHNGMAFCRSNDFEGYVNRRGRWVWKRTVSTR